MTSLHALARTLTLALATCLATANPAHARVQSTDLMLEFEEIVSEPMSDEVVGRLLGLHERAFFSMRRDVAERSLNAIVAWWKEARGAENEETAVLLFQLGTHAHRLGDRLSAIPLLEEAISIRELHLGTDHPFLIPYYHNLGSALGSQYAHARALEALQHALTLAERHATGNDGYTAGIHNSIGSISLQAGDHRAAEHSFTRAIKEYREHLGADHIRTTRGRFNLAILRGHHGHARESLDELISLEPLFTKHYGEAATETADVMQVIAELALLMHDLELARSWALRSVEAHERSEPTQVSRHALALGTLGSVFSEAGELEAAHETLTLALDLTVSSLGPMHHHVAIISLALGLLEHSRGDLSAARTALDRALEINVAIYGEEHDRSANILNAMGMVAESLGDTAHAGELFRKAVDFGSRALGTSTVQHARLCLNLAGHMVASGDYAEAIKLCEDTLATLDESLDDRDITRGLLVQNIGAAHLGLLNGEAALVAFTRTAAIREAHPQFDQHGLAVTYNGRGQAHDMLGQHDQARDDFTRALAIASRDTSSSRKAELFALGHLALLAIETGDDVGALARATELSEKLLTVAPHLATLSAAESLGFRESLALHHEVVLATSLAVGDPQTTHNVVLGMKGLVTQLTVSAHGRLRRTSSARTRELLDELTRVQADVSARVVSSLAGEVESFEDIETSLRKRDRLERELRDRSTADPTDVTTAQVAQALPARAAFVDFLACNSVDSLAIRSSHHSDDPPRMHAWIVRDDSVEHVDLGPLPEIEEATQAFLDDLVTHRGGSPIGRPKQTSPNDALRRLVFDPIAEHLDDIDTVFMAPDGVLAALPFEALQAKDGSFLIEQRSFVYMTDASALTQRGDHAQHVLNGSLLSVGGVEFGRRTQLTAAMSSQSRGGLRGYWGRLPATTYESQVLFDMHEDAVGDRAERTLIQAADATELRLREEMPRHTTLHLATHGFFHATMPDPSVWSQVFNTFGESTDVRAKRMARIQALYPDLFCGLVFAGANRRDGAETGDGYLTAAEVALLDLESVALVVLSACETGLGQARSGEGLIGLRRAFHLAGADTVISSLWSVRDDTTSDLMQSFYEKMLFDGMGRHEALRTAKLEMLRRNRLERGAPLPSTWAGFVLSGDWR